MEVNLIILPKKNSDINLGMKRQIRQLFEKLFNDVNDSSFLINIDDNVEIQYKISSKEKNMVFLKLSCDGTSVKAAKYLDFATNRLIQGEHRKTWNIVISYDEVSQLYCCKLMPLFGIFERRIRELVYITIIKIFGVDWYDNSFSQCNVDGKKVIVASDTTKTKSSRRTLPLVPFVKERLLALKEEQAENRRLCGRSYIKEYLGYVCVNEIGDLIKPSYVTRSFSKLLQANGFRHIRFHDLRHSCASLLLKNGVPMKQIQEWLGHSDFSTTANIYAHLDCSSKLISADAMLNGLGMDSK